MSTWLRLLPLELNEVEVLVEPTDEVEVNETCIGIISDDLKKLWTFYRSLRKSAELGSIEAKFTKASPEESGKISELMSEARALEMIFWIGVMDEFGLWSHKEQCALRVGWRVVEFKAPEMPFPFRFFPGQ